MQKFFRCLGKFSAWDGRVTQKEADCVQDIFAEWGVCKETAELLVEELIAGRDSRKTFERLLWELMLDLSPADRCAPDMVHAFANVAYTRRQRLRPKVRQRLIYIGEILSQKKFLRSVMRAYDDFCEDN